MNCASYWVSLPSPILKKLLLVIAIEVGHPDTAMVSVVGFLGTYFCRDRMISAISSYFCSDLSRIPSGTCVNDKHPIYSPPLQVHH